MSHMIRIGAGVSAAALAIALGIAFWPQIDRSMANGRVAVEKPIFVVPATPVKLEAAVARPQAPAAAPPVAAAAVAAAAPTPQTATTAPAAGVTVVPGSQPSEDDAPLAKLAMAFRTNGSATQPTSAFGVTRGLTITPTNPPHASEDARRLCAQGLVALAKGYIAGARAYLERAAEAGDARALLALGETYDPAALARLGAKGVKGDPARARDYYSQALAAGVGDAREHMAAITSP
jgi:TPR repeat protein